jgi:hypothetical protein
MSLLRRYSEPKSCHSTQSCGYRFVGFGGLTFGLSPVMGLNDESDGDITGGGGWIVDFIVKSGLIPVASFWASCWDWTAKSRSQRRASRLTETKITAMANRTSRTNSRGLQGIVSGGCLLLRSNFGIVVACKFHQQGSQSNIDHRRHLIFNDESCAEKLTIAA